MLLKTSILILLALYPINGIYLECYYSYRSISPLGNLYTCATSTHPSPSDRHIFNVSHNHLVGHLDDHVEALIFNETIEFTPFNIHSFFPNLLSIDLYNKGTSELTRESLKGLNSLRVLNFGLNKLQFIESDLFVENPDMGWIFFESNPIRHVAVNVFNNLKNLTQLYMTDTTCINGSASNSTAVDILKFRILVNCPPTFEMLEEKIVNGNLLQNIVTALVSGKIDPILDKLDEIVEEQRILSERVEALEGSGKLLLN